MRIDDTVAGIDAAQLHQEFVRSTTAQLLRAA
jgi:hypothetical protein